MYLNTRFIGGFEMEKIRKQAFRLGMMDLPLTILYARPYVATWRKMTYHPEPKEVIEHYIKYILKIPNYIHESKARIGRTRRWGYLIPEISLYIEITDEVVGFKADNDENHVLQLLIHSEKEEHVQKIANLINSIYPKGVIKDMNWEKVEKKFEIFKEDCIKVWEELLIDPDETLRKAESLGLINSKKTDLIIGYNKSELVFGLYYPDINWKIRSYLGKMESELIESIKQNEKSITYYYLAPQNQIFIQILYQDYLKLEIYSDQDIHIKEIVKSVNRLYKKGILEDKKMWKTLKKKFKVDIESAKASWEENLKI